MVDLRAEYQSLYDSIQQLQTLSASIAGNTLAARDQMMALEASWTGAGHSMFHESAQNLENRTRQALEMLDQAILAMRIRLGIIEQADQSVSRRFY